MYGDFPAQNTVYTPYIPINVWFWPTLHIHIPSNICDLLAAFADTLYINNPDGMPIQFNRTSLVPCTAVRAKKPEINFPRTY